MQPLQNQANTPNTTRLVCGRRRGGGSSCSDWYLSAKSLVVVLECRGWECAWEFEEPAVLAANGDVDGGMCPRDAEDLTS